MTEPDYFTLDEFRTLPDVPKEDYDDDQVLAAAAYFVPIVEREIGKFFVPRQVTETLDGSGTDVLLLSYLPIQSLTSVVVGGVSIDASLVGFQAGVLRYRTSAGYGAGTPWTRGVSNIEVSYVAGESEVPADIKNAVMQATRDRLLSQNDQSGISYRQTSLTTDLGTINYVLPGEKHPTGYPELDALIASYQRSEVSMGFA